LITCIENTHILINILLTPEILLSLTNSPPCECWFLLSWKQVPIDIIGQQQAKQFDSEISEVDEVEHGKEDYDREHPDQDGKKVDEILADKAKH